MIRRQKWIIYLWGLLLGVLSAMPALGETGYIRLWGEADDERDLMALKRSLDAQLVDFALRAQVDAGQTIADAARFRQEAVSATEAHETDITDGVDNVVGALWLSSQRFQLFLKDGDNQQWFSQPLPQADATSWEMQCDAVSYMVRGLVSTWQGDGVLFEVSPDDVVAADVARPEVASAPESTVEETTVASRSDAVSDDYGNGWLAMGYQGMVMSATTPWLSGAYLAAAWKFHRRLSLTIWPGFATGVSDRFRFYRVPLRIALQLEFARPYFIFGANVGVVADFSKVRALAEEQANEPFHVYWGAVASVVGTVRVNAQFGIQLNMGLDWYTASNRYLDSQNRTLFYFAPVQAHLLAGVVMWW